MKSMVLTVMILIAVPTFSGYRQEISTLDWMAMNNGSTNNTDYSYMQKKDDSTIIANDLLVVIDVDNNEYKTVQIGNQLWMAENLKVTRYRNDDPIPILTDNNDWKDASAGAYCVYDNVSSNAEIYGNLYNWYVVDDPRGLAPEGWHIPSDEEFKELEIYLGMSESEANRSDERGTIEGGMLKEGGTENWKSEMCGNPECPDGVKGCNCSGFTALPGGYRGSWGGGFSDMKYGGHFWTSTESGNNFAYGRQLRDDISTIFRLSPNDKKSGFSVRCIKD